MLWACILLPHLALDSVLRRRPADDGPLVLVTGTAQARHVHAVNEKARAAGLHPGQRLTAARALLAQFEAVEYESDATDRWQQFLAAWAYRYSGEVSTFPQAVVLEVGGSLGLFGPWPRFEQRLRDDLLSLGFRHRIAAASTPRAAWVLAGVRDGVAVDAGTNLRIALADIAVQDARLPDGVAERLSGMGIRRLRQLLALPRDSLRRRFGPGLLDHLDWLLGDRRERLTCYRPPDRFDTRIEFNYEVETTPPLLFPLRRLTADLAAYLAGRDGGVQRFVIRLEHEGATATDVTIGLLSAQRDPAMLFELARGRLEHATVMKAVIAMRLVARELPPFVPTGRDLFDDRPAHALPVEQVRERLHARLGEVCVYRISVGTDPRPERATRTMQVREWGTPPSLPRPTWLLERPIPLRGPPPRILAGPERIETGWWDGGDIRRDYYVVETTQSQRAWVFCPPGETGQFMLHGWFA